MLATIRLNFFVTVQDTRCPPISLVNTYPAGLSHSCQAVCCLRCCRSSSMMEGAGVMVRGLSFFKGTSRYWPPGFFSR